MQTTDAGSPTARLLAMALEHGFRCRFRVERQARPAVVRLHVARGERAAAWSATVVDGRPVAAAIDGLAAAALDAIDEERRLFALPDEVAALVAVPVVPAADPAH